MGDFIERRREIVEEVLEAIVDSGVGKAGIKALLFMYRHSSDADGKKICYMTYDEIAKELGVTRQSVFSVMKKFRDTGIVENKGHGKFEIYL